MTILKTPNAFDFKQAASPSEYGVPVGHDSGKRGESAVVTRVSRCPAKGGTSKTLNRRSSDQLCVAGPIGLTMDSRQLENQYQVPTGYPGTLEQVFPGWWPQRINGMTDTLTDSLS
eukprot:3059609-Rhodomonas_salina.1